MKILNYIKPLFCGAAMLLSFASYGQLVPLDASVLFNGSFAGEAEALRLNTFFSYVHENDYSEVNSIVSLDKFLPGIKSGIGVIIGGSTSVYDPNPQRWKENNFHIRGAVAPKFSIKGKYTISPSLDFGYGRSDVKYNLRPQDNRQTNRLFSRVGLLFNTNKYYVGYSTLLISHHWDNKEKSLFNGFGYISILQAGYTFQRSTKSKFSFTPQIAFVIHEYKRTNWTDFVFPGLINFTFRYDKYIAGINNTGFHLGLQTEKLRVMVSNNPFLFDQVFANGNLSLRYIFKGYF
jgi:hypothetical protein